MIDHRPAPLELKPLELKPLKPKLWSLVPILAALRVWPFMALFMANSFGWSSKQLPKAWFSFRRA